MLPVKTRMRSPIFANTLSGVALLSIDKEKISATCLVNVFSSSERRQIFFSSLILSSPSSSTTASIISERDSTSNGCEMRSSVHWRFLVSQFRMANPIANAVNAFFSKPYGERMSSLYWRRTEQTPFCPIVFWRFFSQKSRNFANGWSGLLSNQS